MQVFFLFLFVLFIQTSSLLANEQKSILIIHSYSQEYLWTKNQHEGFVNYLKKKFNYPLEISTEYLDTKRVAFSEEYQTKFIEYIHMKYKSSPDLVYVTDDNALNFMLKNKNTLFVDTPIVFSGINNLDLQAELDSGRFTGVYEIKDVQQNIEIIKTFSPQTKEIYFLGDATETYFAIEEKIKSKQANFPNMKFHFISAKKFDQVHSQLQNLPNRSFVLLSTIGGFEMQSGENQTLQYSLEQLSSLKNIIIMSMEDAYIQNKVIGGYVTNGLKQGSLAAKKALKILQNVPVQDIAQTFNDANSYMFDRKALLEAQLFLPDSLAKEAIILNQEVRFYVRHEQAILNAFFIIFILILLFMTLIYFISREKKEEFLRKSKSLDEAQKALRANENIVQNIQKLTRSVYWELDLESLEILLINNTELKLALQSQTKSAYDDFFNALICPSDFYALKEAINETMHSFTGAKIEHKILSHESSFISVTNSFEYRQTNDNVKKIVGLISLPNTTQL